MREAVKATCSCVHSILCVVVGEESRRGELPPGLRRLGYVRFFDDEPESKTFGQRVEACPGCDKELGLAALFLALDSAKSGGVEGSRALLSEP